MPTLRKPRSVGQPGWWSYNGSKPGPAPSRGGGLTTGANLGQPPHGNRRLPCSSLSGVECLPSTPCAARLKTLTPETTLRVHHHVHPDSGNPAAKGKTSTRNFSCSRTRGLQPLRNASGRHPAQWPMEGPSGAFGPSMNFPTTERTQSITDKSARPKGMIRRAGTHLVVQGTNRINGT